MSDAAIMQVGISELTELLNICVLWFYNLANDSTTKHEVQKLNLFAKLSLIVSTFVNLQSQTYFQ